MEVVLGVSMTPTAVRMVLVEGAKADGVTVDHDTVTVPPGTDATALAGQVLSAIVGTRDGAVEAAHRLISVGVAWSDHDSAALLRDALRAHRMEDVALVSELHAAGALAQAVGARIGCARTALVFLEGPLATLAVVRTSDGAVVSVASRSLLGAGATAELAGMVAGLESAPEPPQAIFMVGGGADLALLRDEIASRTGLPINAPEDADVALARGAALAAARAPRFEAPTVGLHQSEEALTSAESTQMAAAGFTAPSAYSAVPDVEESAGDSDIPDDRYVGAAEPKPFLLVGSALASIFVVGVIALVISLAVTVRPTVDQRPDQGRGATAPDSSEVIGEQPSSPQTIPAPVPVVQQAPRSVVVAPAVPASAPAPVAVPPPAADPVPVPVPAPSPVPPPPAAPPPSAAPVPLPALPFPVLPPIVITPMLPPLQLPAPVAPRQPAPTSVPPASNPAPTVTTTVTATATSVATPTPSTTAAPAPAPASVSVPPPAVDSTGAAPTTTPWPIGA